MRTPPRASRVLVTLAMVAAAFAALPAGPAAALTSQPDTTWMTNGVVWATVQYGNVLFIGGKFTQVRSLPVGTSGGTVVAANNLAAIDMTTGQGIASFTPDVLGSGLQTAEVHALAVVGDTLYVGGQFSTVDSAAHYNLAAIAIDPSTLTGTVDSTFTAEAGVPGASNEDKTFVYEILPASDGLYVGGSFTKMNATGRSKVAKVTFGGALVKTWKVLSINGAVREMAFSTDGQTIFIAGAFNQLNKASHQSIARVLTSTGKDDPWTVSGVIVGGGSHPGMTCWSLAVTPTRLFAGCGRGPNYAAGFRLDNGNTGNMTWSFGTVGNVQAVALSADSQSLVIGGHFGTFLTQQVSQCGSNKYLKNLGILNNLYASSGGVSLNCGFLPQFIGPNPFGGVWEIQVTSTAIWVGGEFHEVNCDPSRSDTGGANGVWTCTNGRFQESIARFTL
jgi:hypothetical protein